VNGTLDRPLSGGEVKLTISYYSVPLTVVTLDVCKQFGVSCPQKGGAHFRGAITYRVPMVPLSDVTVDVQIDVADRLGKSVSCIKTQAKIAS
jgi:ribose 5-phosphate isomerase